MSTTPLRLPNPARRAPATPPQSFFDAQRRHRRRTGVLLGVEFAFLWALCMLLSVPLRGGDLAPDRRAGAVVALVLGASLGAAVVVTRRRVLGSSEVLAADGAESRALREIVVQMAIASGSPVPSVHVIDDRAPNAYAVAGGHGGAIVCTTGLLAMIDRRELTGVVAHEMAHLRNRDSTVIWTATFAVGFVVALAGVAVLFAERGSHRRAQLDPATGARCNARTLRELDQEARDRRPSRRLAVGFAQAMWLLARPAALLVRAAISRRREMLADASAVQFTRDPGGLRAALEKIADGGGAGIRHGGVATAGLWIAAPDASARGALDRLFDAHPPIEERIAWLRSLEGSGQLWAGLTAA